MKRLFLTFLLAAFPLLAETVYLSPNGKTLHASDHCATLARSKTKLHAEREAVESHGLKPCGMCYRAKNTAKTTARNGVAK